MGDPAPAPPTAPERWRRLEELFERASELEGAERAAFVRLACGDDDALRDEVSSLLASASGAGECLGRVIAAGAGGLAYRDIKPSNVLVDAAGAPKLLGFGIAKLLDPGAGREARTRTGTALLTPEYASPEQVRGERVSAATDVYSLGGALYGPYDFVVPPDREGGDFFVVQYDGADGKPLRARTNGPKCDDSTAPTASETTRGRLLRWRSSAWPDRRRPPAPPPP